MSIKIDQSFIKDVNVKNIFLKKKGEKGYLTCFWGVPTLSCIVCFNIKWQTMTDFKEYLNVPSFKWPSSFHYKVDESGL